MHSTRKYLFLRSFFHRATALRAFVLLLFHAAVFASCYALAWIVRFEFNVRAEYIDTFKASTLIVIGIQLVAGLFFGFYRGWWRYVGLADVTRLVWGMAASTLVLLVLWYVGPSLGIDPRYVRSPRGVLLIDFAFSLLTLFGARVIVRISKDRFRPQAASPAAGTHRRVLIVGAGDAGEALAREIEHRPQLGMKVVGFVDDQRAKWGSQIRGIDVYGPIPGIRRIADNVGADEALLAIPSASGKRLREIIQHLAAAQIEFKTIPGMDQVVSGKVQVTQLRQVNVEDLLRREKIELPGDPVRRLFAGKRVLVTGAGGTIGSELASQISTFGPERLALVERSEFALYEVGKRLSREESRGSAIVTSNLVDICDSEILEKLIERENPQIVIHAAAHKHVPLGEENPPEYLRNNALATRKLAEICAAKGVERFVLISTDKAINPSSVMGASKRAAEILLLDLAARTEMVVTIVRFGNVIGSSGSVIPLFMEQLAAGGPLTVTHPEVTRYFIRTSEAISLVLQAATLGDDSQVFMLDMGEPVRIADLARDLIRLSNHTEEEIPVTFTGLRPGEKLFEEIRLTGESIKPTEHPQIVVTAAPQPDPRVVGGWLSEAHHLNSTSEVIESLRSLIPEYLNESPVAPAPLSIAPTPPQLVVETASA